MRLIEVVPETGGQGHFFLQESHGKMSWKGENNSWEDQVDEVF